MGGRDDEVVGRTVGRSDGQKPVEEIGPIVGDELAVRSLTKLAPGLAVGVTIHNDDRPVIGFPARLGLRQLGRVEGAVTSTADHDNVPQRISLPPSTTRTVPVT